MTPLLPDGPYENVAANLVHAVRGGDVTFSMVHGEPVVEEGRLVRDDLHRIIGDARAAVPELFARRSALAVPADAGSDS